MTDKERQDFKRFASEEIEALKAEVPQLEALLVPVAPDNAIGRISRMDTIVNQSVSEAQLSKIKVRLARLNEALRRVDDDPDFGLCIDCGEPIPMARLKAMPETQYCVKCAE